VRRYSFLLFLIITTSTYAESIKWHDGVLVLKNNDVLVGRLTIQPALNVILFQSEDQSAFYQLDKVDYVTYHDQEANLSRTFLSLSLAENGRTLNHLYEVVLRGRISVVRKPRSAYIPEVTDVGSFDYFVLENGRAIELTQFRKKVFPSMEASCNKSQLKSFMREKGLDPNDNKDALRLIEYFNDGAIAVTLPSQKQAALL